MDKIKDKEQYIWYIRKTIENGWSRDLLVHQIESKLYGRQSESSKIQNFQKILPSPQSDLALQTMKDPYIFDFIEYREDMIETDIEKELVKNITNLLLELGTGFALDDLVKSNTDNSSIGLILCKDENKLIAEYSLKDMTKPIGVSEYKIFEQLPETLKNALPDVEDIKTRITKRNKLDECCQRLELLVEQMKAGAGITEKLKETDQMKWRVDE